MPRNLLILATLTVLAAGLVLPGAEGPTTAQADEELLRSLNIATDGPGLLEFLHNRTIADTDRTRVRALIRHLGDDDFPRREQASRELAACGAPALPLLRQALKSADLEIARRAEACMEAIEHADNATTRSAVIRLLAQRNPPAAAQALLLYLPGVDDPDELEEAVRALGQTGLRDGKPVLLLIKALTDPQPVVRAVAGEVVARLSPGDHRATLHKLLHDRETVVRQRVGLALLERRDKEAVPTLIDLVATLPAEQALDVENVLYLVAGNNGPEGLPDGDDNARQQRRDRWLAWWKVHGPMVDMTRVDLQRQMLGYTLLVSGLPTGKVMEIDAQGKTRWEITGLSYPVDAQVLPGDRVLITEYRGRVVTERNFQGEILWQYPVNGYPITARRLPNGNTFIATRTGYLEITRQGKEILNRTILPGLAAAVRLKDGSVALVTTNGQFTRLDAAGKETRRFNVGMVMPLGGSIDLTSRGGVLVPQYTQGRVVEYDAVGTVVREVPCPQPNSAQRLPNGNLLIASRSNSALVELDRNGKTVWRYQAPGRLQRMSRR
jgi:hypothetical protein